LNAKQLKLEKKKAQYENRLRALEDQNHKLRELVKEQHAVILYMKGALAEMNNVKELSTTHTPYQQPDSQMNSSQQSQESTETIQESDLTPQIPEIHTHQAPAQST
jgi:Sec-independent protein translocase protein TatA